ncbi:hypothetical protein RR46_05713 [Papilio xuthus]|uniref:Uncharacterized protein n=1 Tax=Papilio xuthus TaxID=66420 RepID=A0A194PUL3_PAPXU|nr:hypothetical protein RR46_05713 [Papilio xuthus]
MSNPLMLPRPVLPFPGPMSQNSTLFVSRYVSVVTWRRSNAGSPKYAQIPQMNEAISAPPQQVPLMYCGMVSPQPSFCNVSDMSASASGDDYEYTGGSGDGYQRSSKRSYHGSSSGGTASTPSYHPYRR